MLEIKQDGNIITAVNSDKAEIKIDTESTNVEINGFNVNFPWEYEKWGVLLEVKEYKENLFFNFVSEGKHLTFIASDKFELEEKILKFLNNIDILVIKWSKESAKIFENIESKVVIPYWDQKSWFFLAQGQNPEEVKAYKQKWDLVWDQIEYINLA